MRKELKLLVGISLLVAVLGACSIRDFGVVPNSSGQATASVKVIDQRWLRRTAAARQTAQAKNGTQDETPLDGGSGLGGTSTQTVQTGTPGASSGYTSTPTAITTLNPKTSTPTILAVNYTPTPTSISTVKPTLQITYGPTRIPSFTPFPTSTPFPTPTRFVFTATATPTPIPCDLAAFVKDLSVPDASVFPAGTQFVKTWRLLNAGTCIWTTDYGIVFDSGTKMNGQSPKLIGNEVKPGQTIDVSVTLTAPSVEGGYTGNWMMRNAKGEKFGTIGGSTNNLPFYVNIIVKNTPTNYAVDFVGSYCDAQWYSDAGILPCPGTSGNPMGYVQRIDAPVLENGATDNEPVLLSVPKAVTNGLIHGKYPKYNVVAGDSFRAVLSCAENAKTCNVKFSLDYIQDGETTLKNIASWNKTWDGTVNSVVVDLTPLAGKRIRFLLTVSANGETRDNRAMWLAPRILHK